MQDVLEAQEMRKVIGEQMRRVANTLSIALPNIVGEKGHRLEALVAILEGDRLRMIRVSDSSLEEDELILRAVLARYLDDTLSTDEEFMCYEPLKYSENENGRVKLAKSQRGILIGVQQFRLVVVAGGLCKTGHESLKKAASIMIDHYAETLKEVANIHLSSMA